MVDTKMTKSIGEHWVCAQLARYGWAPALTRDGIERTDILAVATHLPARPSIQVQVKAARQSVDTNWFMSRKAQEVALNNREWFVFVYIPAKAAAEIIGFVVPRDHASAATWIAHQSWLFDPSAKPGTRNTPLGQARVSQAVWEPYEGRWDLLDRPTNEVPVLLSKEVRQAARHPSVGLPPDHPWQSKRPTGWE